MLEPRRPAVATICATLPRGGRPAAVEAGALRTAPVTWCLPLSDVDGMASTHGDAGRRCALLLDTGLLATRSTLRQGLRQARAALPGLESAVLTAPAVLEHHELLAAEGIRVVAVDAFGPATRGSRRPAPAGWSCRSVVWGLWEVRIGAAPSRGWRRLVPRGWTRPQPGSLHVVHDPTPGITGVVTRWIERGRGGGVETILLADLADVLANQGRESNGASVLKAA